MTIVVLNVECLLVVTTQTDAIDAFPGTAEHAGGQSVLRSHLAGDHGPPK